MSNESRDQMKRDIEKHNGACDEAVNLLVIEGNVDTRVYVVGKHQDGFATWAVSPRDWSSYWGHYGFNTQDGAIKDMYERAGLKLGALDTLI